MRKRKTVEKEPMQVEQDESRVPCVQLFRDRGDVPWMKLSGVPEAFLWALDELPGNECGIVQRYMQAEEAISAEHSAVRTEIESAAEAMKLLTSFLKVCGPATSYLGDEPVRAAVGGMILDAAVALMRCMVSYRHLVEHGPPSDEGTEFPGQTSLLEG